MTDFIDGSADHSVSIFTPFASPIPERAERLATPFPVTKPDTEFFCSSYFAPQQDRDHWFNNDTTCYRSRAGYTLRLVEDRFPNIRQMDAPALNMSASRSFPIHERWSFQLRIEGFNLTNTPLYGMPNTDFRGDRFGKLPLDQRNFPRLVQVSGKILF